MLYMLEICDDIGTCWYDLGYILGLTQTDLENINDDHSLSRDKATQVLYKWMRKEGRSATVGILADILIRIGNKRAAEKLLGMYLIIHVYLKTFISVPLLLDLHMQPRPPC